MIEAFGEHWPRIASSAWVHPQGLVIGEVELGEEVTIWPTAVLRGDMGLIAIGDQSNIQDGTVVHNTGGLSVTRVGRRCTVGHRVVLHGCVIEDDCLIGMGSVVMDNAVIGAGSVIGAGAVVPPGKVIPPGSLVLGNPGRVARPTHARDAEMIAHGWRAYVSLIPLYRTNAR